MADRAEQDLELGLIAAEVGPVERFREVEAFQIAFLRARGLLPHHRYLDLGCGVLRGGLPVIEYLEDGNYVGIDIDSRLVDIGRRRVEEAGLDSRRPRLLSAPSFSAYDLDVSFDFVLAYSVLIHLTDEILDECLAFLAKRLAPSGVAFASVNLEPWRPGVSEGRWKQFPVVWRELGFYRERGRAHDLQITQLELTPLERDHWRRHECLQITRAR